MKELLKKTVVITGAASGIGRTTAIKFAQAGANLGLLDFNEKGLLTLKNELKELGVEPLSFKVDVSIFGEVETAAKKIAEHFGRIDVWINNVGVAVYGEVGEVPIEDIKRVMDVNFFGQVNGIYAALPYLKEEESMGRLIGTLSILSEVHTPLQSAYVSSKFALKGFYSCLYEELKHQKSKVKISMILPSSIATPFFRHAKSYMGLRAKAYPPAYAPEIVADLMVKRAIWPKARSIAGQIGHSYVFLYTHFPRIFHWFQSKFGYRLQQSQETKLQSSSNNLNKPVHEEGMMKGNQKLYIPSFRAINATPRNR
jgi:short-subunit dehydrogenase